MTEPRLLMPQLYDGGSPPALQGGVCDCGHVFFPLQAYGCERCGGHGTRLRPKRLAARGRLVASAVVHLHAGERPAPFVVGAIALDDGPVVRTLLTGTDVSLPPGCRMVGTLVPVTPAEDGTPRVDFRFAPATGSDLA